MKRYRPQVTTHETPSTDTQGQIVGGHGKSKRAEKKWNYALVAIKNLTNSMEVGDKLRNGLKF